MRFIKTVNKRDVEKNLLAYNILVYICSNGVLRSHQMNRIFAEVKIFNKRDEILNLFA